MPAGGTTFPDRELLAARDKWGPQMTFWDLLVIAAAAVTLIACHTLVQTMGIAALGALHCHQVQASRKTLLAEKAAELARRSAVEADSETTPLVDLFEVTAFDPESGKTVKLPYENPTVSWLPNQVQTTQNAPNTPVMLGRR